VKVTIAKTAGFCMGVRRAVEMALDAPENYQQPIYTYGPLIHNPQVLDLFDERGVGVLSEIPVSGHGTVLIRAHGVPPDTKERLESAGLQVIDATCPRVIQVQTIIRVHAQKGYATIIVGDKDHPEMIGLLGFAGDRGHVVANLDELALLPAFEKAIIVAQTTQNKDLFESVKDKAYIHYPHYKVFDTICGSTEKRQFEVKELAGNVDAMVVVGGKNSGNTQRLVEIAKAAGKPAFPVETDEDLELAALLDFKHIGIAAGASTPNWIIKRVYRTLENIPVRQHGGWKKQCHNIQKVLILTDIYLALGAGCLCYACIKLMGKNGFFPQGMIAMLYVLSMHIFNHMTSTAEDRFNDPERARFYQIHKSKLIFLGLLAGAVSVLAAFSAGALALILTATMIITGLSYNFHVLPLLRDGKRIYLRIRDIPGSKTIFIAVAWGVVTALLPALADLETVTIGTIIVVLWSTGIVFARTVFYDILDMQEDRIVGKETLPILLGAKRSLRLLKGVLAATFFILIFSALLGEIAKLGYLLTLCPLFLFGVIEAHERGKVQPGVRLEFQIETVFTMAGFIALAWSFII
jgi:(E)-4-hydroxy-3-methyl-but-2-enyl pyrophosphate reductase